MDRSGMKPYQDHRKPAMQKQRRFGNLSYVSEIYMLKFPVVTDWLTSQHTTHNNHKKPVGLYNCITELRE